MVLLKIWLLIFLPYFLKGTYSFLSGKFYITKREITKLLNDTDSELTVTSEE